MMQAELGRCVASFYPGATGIANAAKLSGGASQETWSFDIVHASGKAGAILRRAPQGYGAAPGRAAGIEGETIARKILRDEEFAKARPLLARQLGGAVAGIHALDKAKLPKLRTSIASNEIADLEREYRGFNWPRPVFELALRWLRERDPGPPPETVLVHGDFRHGNLIIGPDGLRAVLDWGLAHLGDAMEDLGWICGHLRPV